MAYILGYKKLHDNIEVCVIRILHIDIISPLFSMFILRRFQSGVQYSTGTISKFNIVQYRYKFIIVKFCTIKI